MSHDPTRRQFLGTTLIAAATVATAPLALNSLQAHAAAPPASKPLPKLPLTDPAAKALAYVEDGTKAKHATFKPGSNCQSCKLYKGVKGQAFGPCTIFPKNTVAAKGWCSAWAKKV